MGETRGVTKEYVEYRKITEQTMRAFGVKTEVDEEGPRNLVIPLPSGRIMLKGIRKKTFGFRDSEVVNPDQVLFGQDIFTAGSAKAITLTEGYCDAMAVYQMMGRYPVVGVQSASSAKAEVSKAYDYVNSFNRIYIAFDADEAGRSAAKAVANLFDFNKVYIVQMLGKDQNKKDPHDYLQNGWEDEFKKTWWAAQRFLPEGVISGFAAFEDIIAEDYAKPSVEYPFEKLQEMTYGIRTGELVLFTAMEGIGKQLPLTTRVPTPHGWTTMGDLNAGDVVFGADGKPTTVTYVSPIQHNVPCYDILFNDGTIQTAGGPHQWGVFDHNNGYHVKTTEEMYKEGVLIPLPNGYDKARYSVPLTKPVEFPEQKLLIDPYTFGYWLGDGYSSSPCLAVGDQDIDDIPLEFTSKRRYKTAWCCRLPYSISALKALGVLNNKHIPREYLRGSIHQRRELLRGLMDSDGGVTPKAVEFYTSNPVLKDNVRELVQSLGYPTRVREKQGKLYGVPKKKAYCVWFLVDDTPVFKLKRKQDKVSPCETTRMVKKSIRDIQPCPSVPSVCIQVDNEDSLYLVENYLVTHNTTVFRHIEHHLLKNTDANIGIIHLEENKARTLKGLAGYELQKPVHLPDCQAPNDEITSTLKGLIKRDDRLHIYSHFGSSDPDDILGVIRFLAGACDCRYIFLDHITMVVTGLAGEDERRALDHISTKAAMMVEELDFSLFMISHVNDGGQTRGSRNIGKVADMRVDLHRNYMAETLEERLTTKMVVSKNRFSGRTGPAGRLVFNTDTHCLEQQEELLE